MRKMVSGAVLIGIAFTPACGMRYDVMRPPKPESKIVSIPLRLQKEKPLTEYIQLPIPKALQRGKPDITFKTLDRE